MKAFSVLCILALSTFAQAATQDWKVVAETSNCSEKIQILAKEGEKFVYALKGDQKTKLTAVDNATFSKDAAKASTFVSDKSAEGETLTFSNPSVVEANPPKIQIANTNKTRGNDKCPMVVK